MSGRLNLPRRCRSGLGRRVAAAALAAGICLGAAAAVAQTQEPVQRDSAALKARLERLLLHNILPFWYPGVIDREHGGYRLNHDGQGQWRGAADKALVTQARTLWFFARLYNDGYGGAEHLAAARHGFAFLRDHMWDKNHGGFYWAVDPTGANPTKADKHLYGQGFALYALAEYIRATDDGAARQLARSLFDLLEQRAYDGKYGGYVEAFGPDWQPLPPGAPTYMGPAGQKLMNTHLHLMEPFTTYVSVESDPLVRQRLVELIFIQSNAVVRKDMGFCTDRHRPDWTPLRGAQYDRVSYGHDIENIWLLMQATQAAGLPDGPLADLYRTLFEYSLQYGFDWQQGGFYDRGPFAQVADQRQKVWWVQAEGLVAALYMYRLTAEDKYWAVFAKTLEWIETEQADWQNGDWHSTIDAGQARGAKAGPWKSPYHNGRAMLEALAVLSQLEWPAE